MTSYTTLKGEAEPRQDTQADQHAIHRRLFVKPRGHSEDSAKDPVPDEYQYQNIRIPARGAITFWRTRARMLPDKRRRGHDEDDVVAFGDKRSSARCLFSFLERST